MLCDLFDGRSQLLAYHFMAGFRVGAEPSATPLLADHFDASSPTSMSRRPCQRVDPHLDVAPGCSAATSNDFGAAFTEEQEAEPNTRTGSSGGGGGGGRPPPGGGAPHTTPTEQPGGGGAKGGGPGHWEGAAGGRKEGSEEPRGLVAPPRRVRESLTPGRSGY